MSNLTTNSKDNIALVKFLCNEIFKTNPILGEITFIQAILEAGLRSSPPSSLALKYNNLFGIKGAGMDGKFVMLLTKEYINKKWIKVRAKFAVNDSVEDSLHQHALLLLKPRYQLVIKAKSFEEAAHELYKAGYATDPKYAQKLIELYNEYLKT